MDCLSVISVIKEAAEDCWVDPPKFTLCTESHFTRPDCWTDDQSPLTWEEKLVIFGQSIRPAC